MIAPAARPLLRVLMGMAVLTLGPGQTWAGAQTTVTPPKPAPAAPAAASFEALARRAATARAGKRLDQAIDLYRQALKARSDWAEGRFVLGTMLYDLDRYPEAREEFRRAALLEPKDGLVLAFKGFCEFQLKNYERALGDLGAARVLGIKSDEVLSVASYHAAILHNRFEQYESAFDILKQFALGGKDSQAVIEALGLSVLRMPFLPGEVPAERRELVLMAGRAAYHQARGRSNAIARQFYEEIAGRYPNVPNVHYAHGVCLLIEDPQAAVAAFRRELGVSPNHHHAMLQIAFEQLKQGEFAEAKTLAEKALELAPSLFAAHQALGRALLELGDTDGAIAALETGAKLAPESPEVFFALARAYAKKGRSEDATRARATFLKLDTARRTARSGPQSVGGVPEAEGPGGN
jgi:tetratricopeptide (TPR) repeat protein